ncbi:DUF3040 domain-containing protein, partial [Curtobacterium sp. P97]|uniref:DUF3040 domain-containing protein n=1 Tax=Curtobacterium sp. P97 TaxID=2939562 RepID=UPI0034D50C21
MTGPDEDRLRQLAAHLEAEDPSWARRFTTGAHQESVRARRALIWTSTVVCLALLAAGGATRNLVLALLALPVAATAVLF